MSPGTRSTSGWIHSWGPYWFPMFSFLCVASLSGYLPASAAPFMLILRVAVPGGLCLWYAAQNSYPELRGYPGSSADVALDVGVGLLGAVIWVAPFLIVPSWAPQESGFDPGTFGASLSWLAIAVRAIGFAIVTPFVEELFVRSWLLRYLEVWDRREDFRGIPIAHFSRLSFCIVMFYFVFSHLRWEWGVMFGWALLTMVWFYHRKHLAPLVLVHAVTNGSILAFAACFDGRITGADGKPIGLWFFL
jgi:CAAX protease family protein